MRNIKFQTGEYYHIYNRGVDKREIFMDESDYLKFLINLRLFNNNSKKEERDFVSRKAQEKKIKEKELSSGYPELSSFLEKLPKLVSIICYCLNPNHYHFILKQLVKDGISKFLHKLDLGYTHYFNQKHYRTGSLLHGTYRDVHITTNEYLIYLSAYINGNIEIHKIAKAEDWPWGSYKDYLALRNGTLCNKNIILDGFENINEYKDLVNVVIKESRECKDEIKKYFLE